MAISVDRYIKKTNPTYDNHLNFVNNLTIADAKIAINKIENPIPNISK